MYELYRDDDISVTSNIILLRKVHELFIKYNKIHTVAVIMKGLWENKEVWYWLMTAQNLEVGLHGWEHKDYSAKESTPMKDMALSLTYYEEHAARGKYKAPAIKKFYPPWNRVSDRLKVACEVHGLELDDRVGPPVYNFHYWALFEEKRMRDLEEALQQ